mmetsp:Transcript_147397/g.257663  ORF Transcript_147397/g.257663 Transcript_147397/m.257663 type:complete len:218 (-) Transcript_147397:36-689(-)
MDGSGLEMLSQNDVQRVHLRGWGIESGVLHQAELVTIQLGKQLPNVTSSGWVGKISGQLRIIPHMWLIIQSFPITDDLACQSAFVQTGQQLLLGNVSLLLAQVVNHLRLEDVVLQLQLQHVRHVGKRRGSLRFHKGCQQPVTLAFHNLTVVGSGVVSVERQQSRRPQQGLFELRLQLGSAPLLKLGGHGIVHVGNCLGRRGRDDCDFLGNRLGDSHL